MTVFVEGVGDKGRLRGREGHLVGSPTVSVSRVESNVRFHVEVQIFDQVHRLCIK